jgi:TIR domain
VPYVPGFAHDVFVSYAHGPKPLAGFRGMRSDFISKWTQSLVDDLSSQLDVFLGTKDQKRRVSIWMDPALDGNSPLSKSINSKIKQSALFLVVMSDFYLDSPWCLDELKWFSDYLGSNDRIFVVKAFNTAVERWPPALKPDGDALPGYTFYTTEHPDHPGKPLGWPQPDETEKAYWKEVWTLADAMASQLKRMEWTAGRTSVSAAAQGKAEIVPTRVGRTLFLGYMHDSLHDLRSDLRARLDKAGFKIVPPAGDDPVDEATVRSAFETYLPASDAIALIANQNSELWPKGQDGGPLGLQFQLAKQYRIPVHLWLQTTDLSTVRNQQYRSFLANVEANARGGSDILIHAADTDEFVRYISGKLDTAPKPSKGAEQLAVVCSNARIGQAKCDELQYTVTEALREAERSSIIPGQEDDSGQIRLMPLQEDISRADTVVVLCFDQEWNWASRIIQQLGQMMGEQGAKTRIFVTGPEDRKKGKFVPAFKFKTVVGVTPDNRVPINEVADEIKKIVGGGG